MAIMTSQPSFKATASQITSQQVNDSRMKSLLFIWVFKIAGFLSSLLYFPGKENLPFSFDTSQILQSESQTTDLPQASEIRFA